MNASAPAPEDLGPRETAVLAELARETSARLGFQGIRRRLGLHQQALARTLRRLERDGLVARREGGYAVTSAGAALAPPLAPEDARVVTLVEAVLPAGVDEDEVARLFSGRWFRGLRWYGASRAPGEATCTWTAERDGAIVRVRVTGRALRIECATEGDPPFESARGLLAPLADLYGSRGPPAHASAGVFAPAERLAA